MRMIRGDRPLQLRPLQYGGLFGQMVCGCGCEGEYFGDRGYSCISFVRGLFSGDLGLSRQLAHLCILAAEVQPEFSSRGLGPGDLVGFMPANCSIFIICVRVPPRHGVGQRVCLIVLL